MEKVKTQIFPHTDVLRGELFLMPKGWKKPDLWQEYEKRKKVHLNSRDLVLASNSDLWAGWKRSSENYSLQKQLFTTYINEVNSEGLRRVKKNPKNKQQKEKPHCESIGGFLLCPESNQ